MIVFTRKIVLLSRKKFFLLFFTLYSSIGATSQGQELGPFLDYDLKGYFEYEYRYFPKKDRKRIASQTDQSVAMSFDLFLDFEKPDLSLLIAPFARIDQRDVSRNILDLSEFYLSFTKPKWELKIGSKK